MFKWSKCGHGDGTTCSDLMFVPVLQFHLALFNSVWLDCDVDLSYTKIIKDSATSPLLFSTNQYGRIRLNCMLFAQPLRTNNSKTYAYLSERLPGRIQLTWFLYSSDRTVWTNSRSLNVSNVSGIAPHTLLFYEPPVQPTGHVECSIIFSTKLTIISNIYDLSTFGVYVRIDSY